MRLALIAGLWLALAAGSLWAHWLDLHPQTPLDVAPKTRKVRRPKQSIINIDPPSDPDNTFDIETYCEDRYRFLLMSEDGRWHCLALTGAPR